MLRLLLLTFKVYIFNFMLLGH